jgi:hypothetical protein
VDFTNSAEIKLIIPPMAIKKVSAKKEDTKELDGPVHRS